MANTGYKRSLSVSVTKLNNGIPEAGYPKTYPTDTDIALGYFEWNSTQYTIPTDQELSEMEQSEYNDLVTALENYVTSIENIDFDNDFINENQEYDESYCLIDLLDGIIGLWEFDESSGGTIYDYSGNEIDGFINSPVSMGNSAPANLGGSVEFGTSTYFEVGDNYLFDISGNKPISGFIWVDFTTIDDYHILMSKGPGSSGEWVFNTTSTGKLNFSVFQNDTSTRYDYVTTDSVVSTGGGWYLLGFSYDGEQDVKIYVNATEITDVTPIGSPISDVANTAYPLRIGKESDGTFNIKGYVSQSGLYDRVINQYEWEAIHNSGSGLYHTSWGAVPTTTSSTTIA